MCTETTNGEGNRASGEQLKAGTGNAGMPDAVRSGG
jgi:hypothetical protein